MTDSSRITDKARMNAVRGTGLLDSAPEREYDRLARLAAQLLGAPAAFVTVISADRQYIKSAVADGERTEDAGTSTALDRSFCQHAVASDQPFIVEDARVHPLVKDNKAVADGVIAYAGIPLQTQNGQSIGALCVIDSKPRQWTNDDIENLRALARSAMNLIDERGRPADDSLESDQGANSQAPEKLLDCVEHHLRAAAAYDALVSAANLDLTKEANARTQLTQSLADLHESFDRHCAAAVSEQADLVNAVQHYLEADRERDTAARAFGNGETDLRSLEGAITRHMDAADALRITAIDHGAEL